MFCILSSNGNKIIIISDEGALLSENAALIKQVGFLAKHATLRLTISTTILGIINV